MSQASIEDYRVELDYYSGPLDLLLHLVKRHEIDLQDLPIAKLTEQYLDHLKHIQKLDINLAGEFLVMAATLLEIKAQMIAPRPEADGEDGEADAADAELSALDPRYELVQQLLEYKRFKDAAIDLETRLDDWKHRVALRPARERDDRPEGLTDEEAEAQADEIEIDLEDANVLELCEAFTRLLASIGQGTVKHEVVYDDTPIALHAEDILDRLKRDAASSSMTLQQMFVGRTKRTELIGLFLATLELVRQKRVKVVQPDPGGEISIRLSTPDEQLHAEDDQSHDWRDPETGEVQYDWPSEEAREMAESRARRRIERAKNRQFGKADEDDDDIIDVDGDDDESAADDDSASATDDDR